MPIYRITWEFDGPQRAEVGASASPGWTESWYNSADTIDTALTTATSAGANSWLTFRRRFLANIYRIGRVRATDPANARLSKSASVRNSVGLAGDPAQVTCAVLADFTVLPKVSGDTTHHRRAELRGLPASLINGNIINTADPTYTFMRAFCSLVGNVELGEFANPNFAGIWLIAYQDSTVHKQPILGLTVAGPTSRFLTITNDFGPLAVGTALRITGTKFPAFTNRIWKVRAVVGVGVQLTPYTLGNSRRQLAGVWDGLGNIQLVHDLYAAPDQFTIAGLRTRATGRPFPLTRGRRSRG